MVTLFLSLLFFKTPSNVERVLGYIVFTCLLVQFILMWTLPRMRHAYGAIGIFITGWTTLCLALGLIVSPRLVLWGKTHEEVRLTGRRETRRSISEWLKISASFLLVTLFVVLPGILMFLGFMLDVYDITRLYRTTGAAVPGTMVPVSTGTSRFSHEYSVYIECTPKHRRLVPPLPEGQQAPIVLIESDDRISSQVLYEGWLEELYNVNKVSRVCLWNRPGRGFSDNAPSPFTLGDASDALTKALNAVLDSENPGFMADAESPPFQNNTIALVAHGLGGVYSRVFAARHLSSIHSILLIDTVHEDILRWTIGPIARGFGLWLEGMVSPLALRRQLSWLLHGRGPTFRYLSGMNAGTSGTRGGFAYNTKPGEIKASLQDQLVALSGSMQNEIEDSNNVLQGSNIPIAVVASAQSIRRNKEWSGLQRRLASLTANNVAFEVFDGPHEVWTARKAKEQLQDLYDHVLREKKYT